MDAKDISLRKKENIKAKLLMAGGNPKIWENLKQQPGEKSIIENDSLAVLKFLPKKEPSHTVQFSILNVPFKNRSPENEREIFQKKNAYLQ